MRAAVNRIEIEYETHGRSGDPAVLLIMGLSGQLTLWPDEFCDGLARAGYFVIRYDNRDVGLSSDFDHWGLADLSAAARQRASGQAVSAPYTLDDMAEDGLALLSHLGQARAHMVGMSMGGMIAQIIAARQPERTLSLTSIMSTSSRPGLPEGTPEARAALLRPPLSEEREEIIRHSMNVRRIIGSPAHPIPEEALRAFVARNVDRRYLPQGAGRQYLAVMASGDRVALLPRIGAPSLVIHGADDPVLPPACGRDVADLIPGAQWECYAGMGHDIAPGMVPTLVERIARHLGAAQPAKPAAAD